MILFKIIISYKEKFKPFMQTNKTVNSKKLSLAIMNI